MSERAGKPLSDEQILTQIYRAIDPSEPVQPNDPVFLLIKSMKKGDTTIDFGIDNGLPDDLLNFHKRIVSLIFQGFSQLQLT